MFNYSLNTSMLSNGVLAPQYTLPYDYMGSYFNNPNYLQNSMYPYMMQGYNPTFNANNSNTNTSATKKEKVEYTPVYAADEIYNSSSSENKNKKSGFGKCLVVGTTLLAGAFAVVSLVSGAKSYNGSIGQYIGNLFKKGAGGVKNLWNNTSGLITKPLKKIFGAT